MKKSLAIVLIGLVLSSCSTNPEAHMAFEEVRYIREFPRTYSLTAQDAESVDFGIIGTQDFIVHDSLLILSTANKNGFLTFLSLPDHRNLGSYLLLGNGPQEFIMPPWISQSVFYREKGDLCFTLHNVVRKRLECFNVTRTLESKRLHLSTIKDSLVSTAFRFLYINDSTFMCREITSDETRQIRYFIENGRRTEPLCLIPLNESRVNPGHGDYNILATLIQYNPDRRRVVEAPTLLNHINLYAPDGSFARTICVGKRLDKTKDIQAREYGERIRTYMHLLAYPDFFGALYFGATEKEFELEPGKISPVIQLFDWDGEPLAEIRLPYMATAFDFDLKNGALYTFDRTSEQFQKYDITDLNF